MALLWYNRRPAFRRMMGYYWKLPMRANTKNVRDLDKNEPLLVCEKTAAKRPTKKKVADDLDKIAPLLVCEKVAAKLIGVSPASLCQARFRRRPYLPFLRVGPRLIRGRSCRRPQKTHRDCSRAGSFYLSTG